MGAYYRLITNASPGTHKWLQRFQDVALEIVGYGVLSLQLDSLNNGVHCNTPEYQRETESIMLGTDSIHEEFEPSGSGLSEGRNLIVHDKAGGH